MTRTDYLQAIVSHGPFADDVLTVSFTPFKGWFLIGEPRWFGDDGCDYIGRNWREAEQFLRKTFPSAR